MSTKASGWTSIEQSNELIKAGLDIGTADMFYKMEYDGLYLGFPAMAHELLHKQKTDIPCWSLGRLIGLMPKAIETKRPKNLYFPEILPASNGVAYTAPGENNVLFFLKLFSTGTENNETLIDNVVLMILWLLKNKHIKKGKREDD